MADISKRGAWLVSGSAGPGGIELTTVDGHEIVYDLADDEWHVVIHYGQGAGANWIGPLGGLEEVLAYLGRP